ncbi:MAG: hypothetical protein J1D99_04775 [Campylobacter sp.]|nr:hypothetical protein [Campylobacter sp.]
MQVNETNSKNQALFQTNKSKQEQTSNEEFQAYLNEAEKVEQEKQQWEFSEEEMNLSNVLKDFQTYATNKSIQDKKKQNEATLLNKLFAMIDSQNGKL